MAAEIYSNMYTESDYRKELAFDEWIENHDPFKIMELEAFKARKYDKRKDLPSSFSNEFLEDSPPFSQTGFIRVAHEPDPISGFDVKGVNIPYLKRSYFDPRKLKTTLKIERVCDKNDDYSVLFMSLWTQLEHEYKERFYKIFIPGNKNVIFSILEETSPSKYNYFEDAVNKNYKPTFGLINIVMYAVEIAMKYDNKKVMTLLSEILGTSFGSFFKKYSLYEKLEPICNEVRNPSAHGNLFIPIDKYNAVCVELFGHSTINNWCNSDKVNLFTEYLKILPKSDEEKEIERLEKLIRLAKLQGGNLSEKWERHESPELRLDQLKEGLNRI